MFRNFYWKTRQHHHSMRLLKQKHILATKQTAAPKFCCNYTTPDDSSVCINLSDGTLVRSLSSNINLSVVVGTLPFASLLPLPPLPGASL